MNQKRKPGSDTIVALATPRGKGALAIIRLSGENAIDIAARCVSDSDRLLNQDTRRIFRADILMEDGDILDKALCALYRRPNSYTGENTVEFFLHGSPYIIAKTIDLCCRYGVRVAEPGEFTLRAFLNGRMDLTQAEAVADIIAAQGAESHRIAMQQREGRLSRNIRNIRDKLVEILSLVELGIDFSDQDTPVLEQDDLLQRVGALKAELETLKRNYQRGRIIREGITLVIAGAPNVGKSTLFNALLGEYRAIVHETPGTTRDPVEGQIDWDGFTIRLVDTAGQDDFLPGPDSLAVGMAKHRIEEADGILWVFDLSNPSQALPQIDGCGQVIYVGNKVDLVHREGEVILCDYISVSALKGEGLEKIKEKTLSIISQDWSSNITEGMLTRERHYQAVCNALGTIETVRKNLEDKLGEELIAEDLRDVISHLGGIIGDVTSEEVLERIFGDFCIGK